MVCLAHRDHFLIVKNRLVTVAVESGLYTATWLMKNPVIGTGGFYFLRKAEPKGNDIRNEHEHILPIEEEEEDSPWVVSVMALLAIASAFGAVALLLNEIVSMLLPKAEEKVQSIIYLHTYISIKSASQFRV